MERILRSSTRASPTKAAKYSATSLTKAKRPVSPSRVPISTPDKVSRYHDKSTPNVGHGVQNPPSKKVRLQTPEPLPTSVRQGHPTDVAAINGVAAFTPDLVDRPAEPHVTNAPLITPRGSRITTYTTEDGDASPSKTGLPRPTTTTGHMLEDACAHLIRMDSRLKPVIDKHYCRPFCPDGLAEECDPFKTLCSGIMAQQVSGAAASSIKRKFIGLFHEASAGIPTTNDQSFPTPVQVSTCTVLFLRQAGLSERKAEYIKGLAEKFACGELSASILMNASDEEIMEKLTAVRGLGRWSVEMFACFGLKRMDILSTGDLGVQYDFYDTTN